MYRTVRPLAAAMTACLCLATTGATADQGFYVGLGAGLWFSEDSDARGHPSEIYSPPFDATGTHDQGTAFSGAVGYRFAEGLRVEGELSYRENDLDEFTVREPGSLAALLPPASRQDPAALDGLRGTRPIDGDLSVVSLMANLYYDVDLGLGLKPYVGGGIGLSRISIATSSSGRQLTDDDDTVFAYQLGAGLGYRIGGSDDRPVIVGLDLSAPRGRRPDVQGFGDGNAVRRRGRRELRGRRPRFGL